MAPIPWWIANAPDEGISIVDQGNGVSPPATDLALIGQGEIPALQVIHTAGPARTMMTCAWRVNMLPTPYLIPHTPALTTNMQPCGTIAEQQEMGDSDETLLLSLSLSQPKNIIFSSNAMFFGPNAVFQHFITNKHHRVISNVLSAKHRKMVNFSCDGVCDAYILFPPRGHALPPDQYCTMRVDCLIHGSDVLIFMHDIFFDENRFIMVNIIQFIWYWGHASFLGDSPFKTIKHIFFVDSGRPSLEVNLFGGQVHENKFDEIKRVIQKLPPAEKSKFEQYLQLIIKNLVSDVSKLVSGFNLTKDRHYKYLT
ncbi:hypothetical protein BDR04DRAFT_1122123 [Suillus decipiens]|nr:hypothetical protein BDR04DRAFT_1122123 [Suillus decipiens]